jgi:hypothetical protein
MSNTTANASIYPIGGKLNGVLSCLSNGAIVQGQPVYFTTAVSDSTKISVATSVATNKIHGIAMYSQATTNKPIDIAPLAPGDFIYINYNGSTPTLGVAYGIDQYGCLDQTNTTQKNLRVISVTDTTNLVCLAQVTADSTEL